MGESLQRIREPVARREVMISVHGYDELAADEILVGDIVAGVVHSVVVQDYPAYPKRSCVLVLQRDPQGKPIHVEGGVARETSSPAVVLTAYRPDPARWTSDFIMRRAG